MEERKKNSFEKKKNDYESFHSDILNSDLIKKPEKDLSALCQQYDSLLSSILDKYAPVSRMTLLRKSTTPCMTTEMRKPKTLHHNIEQTLRRSHTHNCEKKKQKLHPK